MLQRHAIQKLHGNEGLLVMLTDLVNRADIRMVESGSRSPLAAKTFKRLRVLRHIVRKEFQCDEPPKLRVFSFVDHAHTTTPDLFEDAVVRDGVTNHGELNVHCGNPTFRTNSAKRGSDRRGSSRKSVFRPVS